MKKILLVVCLSLFVYANNEKVTVSIYSKAYSKQLKSKAKEIEAIFRDLLPSEAVNYVSAKSTLSGIRKFYKGVKPTAKYLSSQFFIKQEYREWLQQKNVDYLIIVGIKVSKKKLILFHRILPVENAKVEKRLLKASSWDQMRSKLTESIKQSKLVKYVSSLSTPSNLGWFDEEMPTGLKKDKTVGMYVWEKDNSSMVYVSPGAFQDQDNEETLKGFYIDKYETTNEQFCLFLNQRQENPETYIRLENSLIEKVDSKYQPKENASHYPAIQISWQGAKAYSDWAGKALPTSVEWRKALRGGHEIPKKKKDGISLIQNQEKTRSFPWGATPPDEFLYRCNYSPSKMEADGYKWVAPVIAYEGLGDSPYDCSNLMGNVWEWCNDGDEGKKICQGGSWSSSLQVLQKAFIQVEAEKTSNDLGFRTVIKNNMR